MRAVVCTELTGEDGLEVRQDWPAPTTCPPDGLRIRVEAAAINFPDTLITRGQYQLQMKVPFVVGGEAAGVVVEAGGDRPDFRVGDRVLVVTGAGAFADEVIVGPYHQTHRLPPSMSFVDAAAFNLTFGTAGHGLLERGHLTPEDTVLITGAAGGCGSAAIQVAKAAGAAVIAIAGGSAKAELVRHLGADRVIDHAQLSGERALSTRVRELTAGSGVDVVFDTVGADMRDLTRTLAWNGRLLVVGFAGGAVPSLPLNLTILKSISIIGVAYGASALLDPAANATLFEQLFRWYAAGVLRPCVTTRVAPHGAVDAIRAMRERGALGKLVIDFTATR